jgi:hypothetical protein
MKNYIILLLILLINSCQIKPRINNEIETLEKVFSRNKFDIEIQRWGCFGGNVELFNVSKDEKGYLLRSVRTKRSHVVFQNQIDSLKCYLKDKIGKYDEGICTYTESITIGTVFNSITYCHSRCSGIEATIIDDLLHYSDLIQNTHSLNGFQQDGFGRTAIKE